jgi:nicotinamidase-related amidase
MSELAFDPKHAAVVVIDLQKGIVGRNGAPYSAADVIKNVQRLLRAGRAAGLLPVLVHVGGAADGSDRLAPPADQAMRAGSLPPDWSELIPELERTASDVVILKRQWGAFYGTDLDLQLRRRRRDTILLCGIATEFGVESTARDAYERGYAQVFVSDAMTGLSEASHEDALTRIFPRIGLVRTTEEVLKHLERRK